MITDSLEGNISRGKISEINFLLTLHLLLSLSRPWSACTPADSEIVGKCSYRASDIQRNAVYTQNPFSSSWNAAR